VTSQGPWLPSVCDSITAYLLDLNYVNVTWENSDYNGDRLLVLVAQKPSDLAIAEANVLE
ncbi:hypothetical protein, partial [Thermanaerothrix sp.]|uniref:hypothetical protein n=1 Tax=Thermanaerothrix sp. TaxID=2972675 RepID=UPI003C7D7131